VSRILCVGRFRTEAGSSKIKGETEHWQGGGEDEEDVLDSSTVEGPRRLGASEVEGEHVARRSNDVIGNDCYLITTVCLSEA
jgi:hypothetical protein